MYLPPLKKRARNFLGDTNEMADRRRWLLFCMGYLAFLSVAVPYLLYIKAQRRARFTDHALASNRKGKRVVIVGGGAGGCAVAATMTHRDPLLHVTVLEQNAKLTCNTYIPHAHVGQVSFDIKYYGPELHRSPTTWNVTRDARLVLDKVDKILPDRNEVVDAKGTVYPYDGLVLALGCTPDISGPNVAGLTEATVDCGSVCYLPFATRDRLAMSFNGTVLFAKLHAAHPLKRQFEGFFVSLTNKLYAVATRFNKLHTMNIICCTPDYSPSDILPVAVTETIEAHWTKQKSDIRYRRKLVAVNTADRTATFENLTSHATEVVPYTLLIVDPPVKAPKLIARSGLDGDGTCGFVDVDPQTLQHRKYKNIFAIGDCAALPTAKSYGAVFAQAPYVSHNLDLVMKSSNSSSSNAAPPPPPSALLDKPSDAAANDVTSSGGANNVKPNGAPLLPVAPKALGRYGGYSSFFVSTGYMKAMWPEVQYSDPSDPWLGPYRPLRSNTATSSSALREGGQGELLRLGRGDDARWWSLGTRHSGPLSRLCGFFVESEANAVMFFFIFLRGEWTASNWFSSPI